MTTVTRPRVPRMYGIPIMAVSAAMVIVAGVLLILARSNPAASGGQSFGLPTNYQQPLPGGIKTTVAAAQAAVGFPIQVPDNARANLTNLVETWLSPGHRQAALVFDGGRVTIIVQHAMYRDPAAFFRKMRFGMRAKTSIIEVNGRPTLVVFRHTARYNLNPSWVEFDQNGVDVNIVSTTYGTEALIAIAASMR
jgi:hypothetical protein